MVKPTQFEVGSELDAGAARITPVGELDIASAGTLERAVNEMLVRDPEELLIDLSGVSFIDSSGLRLFIDLQARAGEEGWGFSLIAPVGQAFTVFEISGADGQLPFVKPPSG